MKSVLEVRMACIAIHTGMIFLIYCLTGAFNYKNGGELCAYMTATAFAAYVWYDCITRIYVTTWRLVRDATLGVVLATAALYHEHHLDQDTVIPFVAVNAICIALVAYYNAKYHRPKGIGVIK